MNTDRDARRQEAERKVVGEVDEASAHLSEQVDQASPKVEEGVSRWEEAVESGARKAWALGRKAGRRAQQKLDERRGR